MSIRMHTAIIANFLCSVTVEEWNDPVECPATVEMKKFIRNHTRKMKNLEYINSLVVERLNKRTLQR